MNRINIVLAENLRHLREQRRLSLDTLSRLTGVSKSMLGQIERGEVNPTISTVWKISDGLKVSFTQLTSRAEEDFEEVDALASEPLVDDGGRFRNYPVFAFDSNRRFEVCYIEIEPDGRLEAEPHQEGTQEFLTAFSGRLAVGIEDKIVTAERGGGIRFRADRAHSYHNLSEEPCRVCMVIYYPDSSG